MRTHARILALLLTLAIWSCGGEGGTVVGDDAPVRPVTDVAAETRSDLPGLPDDDVGGDAVGTPDVEPSLDVPADTPEPVCLDSDGDGYGDGCVKGPDCNDEDLKIHPGSAEICGDGVDQDCDDQDLECPPECVDVDGDGYMAMSDVCPQGGDCDDGDIDVNPGAEETPYNGVDDDCSEVTSDDDVDGDGFVAAQIGGPDCNDDDDAVNPDAEEVPGNGKDDDCDPATSDTDNDADDDGYDSLAGGGGDCDDGNPDVNPGAPELCGDWVDNNCDGFPVPGGGQPECPQGHACNLATGECGENLDCTLCPVGQVCQGGQCVVDPTCYGGCPAGQECVPETGVCMVQGCLVDGCPDDGKNWACNPYTGVCYISSCEGGCPKGEFCDIQTGNCYVDENCGGGCMMNEYCNKMTGTCEPDPNCPNDFCAKPEGTVRVEGPDTLYYVDQYEWPNVFGEVPKGNVGSKQVAQGLCLSVARRLCTLQELGDVCDGVVGPEGTKYPYANTADANSYDPLACNTEEFAPIASGSYPACHNEAFLSFDLVGNVAEWTSDGVLFGGSVDDGLAGTCDSSSEFGDSNPAHVGFRCCISPSDDLDADGFVAAQDCDNGDGSIHPGAEEKCNAVDDNCNGEVDELPDGDGDGFAFCDDCNDNKFSINPGQDDPVGDGVDQNCDGVDGVDADGDGQASVASGGEDCDDDNPGVFHDCSGLQCGPDPLCGQSCGVCAASTVCNAGYCVPSSLKWKPIPGGTFTMGCSPGDGSCYSDEKPPHSVTLSPFEMLETEVTEAQYLAVTGDDPSCDYGAGGGADSPVECVDWYEAKAFCDAVGGRLCTEAEWEYAARGGTTTKYYCGNSSGCLDGIAWWDDNSGSHKHDVKGKAPNAYGLYDMLGNVWEWTADWYSSGYYSASPANNPKGPNSGSYRVIRGGCFDNGGYDGYLRVSGRDGVTPSGVHGARGLRCCRSE